MSTVSDCQNLQEIISAKIATIADTAEELPCVVIIHDLRDWSVAWMSERGLKQLGITLEEITSLTSEQYFTRFFNPEDSKDYVPKILGLMELDGDKENVTYFQQVRLAIGSDWNWHMGSTKIFLRDPQGKPLLTITLAFAIDAMHHMAAKADRLLEENNFLRKHYHVFAKLSPRERDILRLLALGKSAPETAEILFISTATVETHRKNIKQKLETNSFYELSQYARSFDLI